MADVDQIIRDQYPQLAPFLDKPGVRDVFMRAVNENWPAARLESALRQTPYWQQSDEAQRQWDVLTATDPAEAQRRQQKAFDTVKSISDRLGLNLNLADLLTLTNDASRMGMDQQTIQNTMVVKYYHPAAGGQPGELGAQMTAVQKVFSDYGLHVTDAEAVDWARRILIQHESEDSVRQAAILRAKSYFNNPDLDSALDRGVTVAQYGQQYAALAAQELGIDASTIDFSKPKWQTAIATLDPKTNQKRPMTLSEWQTHLRSDAKYGYDQSVNGRTQAAQFAGQLAEMFGAK